MPAIAILGEFNPANETHQATNAALDHAGAALGIDLEARWVDTGDYRDGLLEDFAALLVAPGSPYRDFGNALEAIRWARVNRLPTLGTCGGFQHMLIEYARNVLGITEADHEEVHPDASVLFISGLYCSLAGKELPIDLIPGTRVAALYESEKAIERYYCNFGVNPEYLSRLKDGPLVIAGSDAEGEIRVIELPDHPFFVGTLFVPQALSTPERPHPLLLGFVRAARRPA